MSERKGPLSHVLRPLVTHGFLLLVFPLVASPLASGRATQADPAGQVVAKYIKASQSQDFKTMIDLTEAQGRIKEIKASNPQVLWPRLIEQYYQRAISALADRYKNPSYLVLFPASCKWTITEVRHKGRVRDAPTETEFSQATVYVTVRYPSWDDAPLLERGILQETIVEFTVNSDALLVFRIERLSVADEYKQDPLRISEIRWQQMADAGKISGMYIKLEFWGGTPPFNCFVQAGTARIEKECYRSLFPDSEPRLARRYGEMSLDAPQAFPLPFHLKITDSKGRADEVYFTVPGLLPGIMGTTFRGYCWVRDPWFTTGRGHPERFGLCEKPINRLGDSPESGPTRATTWGVSPVPTANFYPPTGDASALPSLGWLGNNPAFANNPIHLGTDFARGYGTPVYSMARGKIILVKADVGKYGGLQQTGGGMFVKYRTQTEQTFYALYAHVENMKPEGSCVKAGGQIGTVGHYYYDKQGEDDRPHLHFAVFFGDELPSGEGWPWRQYVSDPSDAPGWQDPLFVIKNMRPGASPCDSVSQPKAAEEPKPDVAPRRVIAPPTPERQIQRFRVKHRHMGPDARGNVSFVASYCEGELRVTPEGNVEYICDRADTVRSRCERGRFPPIKQVAVRDDGGLRITLMQGGNWDFYGSRGDIKAAYQAISVVVTK